MLRDVVRMLSSYLDGQRIQDPRQMFNELRPAPPRPLNEQSPFLADCCFLQPITDQYEVMRTAVGNGLPTEPLAGELEEIRLLLPGKPEIAFSPQYAAAPLFDETFQLACRQA